MSLIEIVEAVSMVIGGYFSFHFVGHLPSGHFKIIYVKKMQQGTQKSQQNVQQRLSSLTLQVCLHLHVHLLPICLFSQLACFALKFSILHPTYRVVLLALHLISVCVQLGRPYLGYVGNLGEQIPALSGFWILSALLHLPAQCFLVLNPDIHPLPLERYTIFLDVCLSIVELACSTLLIRRLAQRQMEYFRQILAQQQQQIGPEEQNVGEGKK